MHTRNIGSSKIYDKRKWKLKVTLKVLDNVAAKYPDTKTYIEENLNEVCEGEGLTVEEVIYYVGCFYLSAWLWRFGWIDGLLFNALAICFWKVDKWVI